MPRLKLIAVLLMAALCTAIADDRAKRIVVQLRNDPGQVVSVSVLEAPSRDGSLSITRFAQRAVPGGVAPPAQFWYVGDIFRLSDWKSRAFKSVLRGRELAITGKLTVRDLRDGDIIVLHHPYP